MQTNAKRLPLSGTCRIALGSLIVCAFPAASSAQSSSLFRAAPMFATPAPSNSTARQSPSAQNRLGPVVQAQAVAGGQPPPGPIAPRTSYRGPVDADGRPLLSLTGASWTYEQARPLRSFQKNDIVTIRVDEITRVMAEGSAESRKRTAYEAILTDWIRITDFRLRPDPQGFGDPTVATESNNNVRAESTVESRESMTFNIAATVVDIRPNGTLVLEATKTIRVNDNLWETSLVGECRAQDIAPDNVVLSKDLIDLNISKSDRGQLRDGYKRGWFQRWFDRVQPF